MVRFLDPEIVKIDDPFSGSRNRQNGAISGSRNRKNGRQILYVNSQHLRCEKNPFMESGDILYTR